LPISTYGEGYTALLNFEIAIASFEAVAAADALPRN
jgi:hypothetical protein